MVWSPTLPLALVCCAGGLFGQSAGTTSGVEQIIRHAFERSREMLAAQQRVAEARGLLRQAGVRPVATLEVNGGSGRPLGTRGEQEYTAGYFQPIETGGKRSKRVLVAEQAVALAEADLAERQRQLAYAIRTRFIDAAAGVRRLEALGRIAATNRESYALIDARVQRDDAAPLERQLLLVELNRTDAQRAAAAGRVRSARLELQRAAGSNDDAEIPEALEISTPPPVSSPSSELRTQALESRPDLRAAETLVQQSAAELALAEAQAAPDLTVSAQYSRRSAQFEDPLRTNASGAPLPLRDRDNILSLGVSIPLQSRRRNAGNIEAAAARRNAAMFAAEQLAITIPLEVAAAWERYRAAQAAIALLNRGVLDESRKNLAIIRQAYDLGQLRLLDVLAEQRRLVETEMSFIEAEAELARSRAELEYAVGGEVR